MALSINEYRRYLAVYKQKNVFFIALLFKTLNENVTEPRAVDGCRCSLCGTLYDTVVL